MTAARSVAARPPALLFGVAIADTTMSETLDSIGEMVAVGREREVTHQIATVNVDFLVNAFEDDSLAAILRDADLCLADGAPIVWMAKAFGMPIAERVAGADLVPLLFERSKELGWRIHVFGSSAAVASRAEDLIASRYPGAVVTFEPGPVITDVADVDDAVIQSIVDVDADVVCVALGNPKQERFIAAHGDRIGAPVMIGIGGSIDMLVGERTRAPTWMQRVGLEWVARAVQEPRRLGRRYAHDIRVMLPRSLEEVRAHRRRGRGGAYTLEVADIAIRATLGGDRLPPLEVWTRAVERLADRETADVELVIDPAGAVSVSDVAAAHLVGLVDSARRYGRPIRQVAGHGALVPSLEAMGVAGARLGFEAPH